METLLLNISVHLTKSISEHFVTYFVVPALYFVNLVRRSRVKCIIWKIMINIVQLFTIVSIVNKLYCLIFVILNRYIW